MKPGNIERNILAVLIGTTCLGLGRGFAGDDVGKRCEWYRGDSVARELSQSPSFLDVPDRL